jgi:hypothetical protein
MTRLSLQVVYLWRHVSPTAPPFILWWSNLEIIFSPLHRSSPFIGELRCQAIQVEHGPYIAERTQNAVGEMSVYLTSSGSGTLAQLYVCFYDSCRFNKVNYSGSLLPRGLL